MKTNLVGITKKFENYIVWGQSSLIKVYMQNISIPWHLSDGQVWDLECGNFDLNYLMVMVDTYFCLYNGYPTFVVLFIYSWFSLKYVQRFLKWIAARYVSLVPFIAVCYSLFAGKVGDFSACCEMYKRFMLCYYFKSQIILCLALCFLIAGSWLY